LFTFCCCCCCAGPYLVTWQAAPVVPRYPAYNWDLYSDPENTAIENVFKTGLVTFSSAYLIHVEGDDEINESNEIYADFFKDYIDPGEESMEPISDINYPVRSNAADNVAIPGLNNETDSNVVAMLALSIYWRDMLQNILPTGADGVDVVFSGECSPSFTYRINGPTTTYRGSGDLHEPAYSHMGTSANLFNLPGSGRSYSGLPISQDYCPYTLTVYPSAVMQGHYTTQTPMLFTIAAVMIFLFTSAVFVLYDIMVERRQKLVLSTAAKSSAIVSSLFPSNVRAELMKEQEQKERERVLLESPKRRLKTFLLEDENTARDAAASPTKALYASKPLAELYAETTVFFGDIAGFTAWSMYYRSFDGPGACLAFSHIALFPTSQVHPASLVRFLLFSKPCMEHLMQSLENEASSRSKRLATRTLQLWTTRAPKESCHCHGQVCHRLSKQDESTLSRTRTFTWTRNCGSETTHWTSFRTRHCWCASWGQV
jgi:hypothetical protein